MPTSPDQQTATERIINASPVQPHEHAVPAGNTAHEQKEAPKDSSPKTPADTPETKPAPKSSAARFREVAESAKTVEIEETLRIEIADRLEARLLIIQTLKKGERPLTTMDKMILEFGDPVAERLRNNSLTDNQIAIVYYALYDEALQKQMSAGLLATADVQEGQVQKKGLIGFRKKVRGPAELVTSAVPTKRRQSSEYTRHLGFDQWSKEDQIEDISALTRQLRSFEARALGLNPTDIDEILSEPAPNGSMKKSPNLLRNEVLNQLEGPNGILAVRHNGKTLFELWNEDRITALSAIHEANEMALTAFADQKAMEFLTNNKPAADTVLIEKHATALEAEPTQEDLAKTQAEATRTTAEFAEAQTRLNELNAPVEAAERDVESKQLAFDRASHYFDAESPALETIIKETQKNIDFIRNNINKDMSGLTNAQKADANKTLASLSEQIKQYQDYLKEIQKELQNLSRAKTDAELELQKSQQELKRAKTEPDGKEHEQAKADLDAKKTAKEQAEKELKEKPKNPTGEASPENKEKAKALREWITVINGYENIVEERFSQTHESEYTRERLADTTTSANGQIMGAEKIREHIFQTVLKDKAQYDPALARKMLSDETIARAIAWVYKLDLSQITTKNAEGESVIDIAKALPYLRSSQFKAGDLIRFVVQEGVKSAEHGEPYLALGKFFENPEPELKLEAESIYQEGVGVTEINAENNTVKWTGQVKGSLLPDLFNNNLPITYRVTQSLKPDRDIFTIEAMTDQRFLQSLPDTIDLQSTKLPVSIQTFYDENGNLQADKNPPGSWIKIDPEVEFDDPDGGMTNLEQNLSPDAPKFIYASLADYMLQKSPKERLEILRGLNADMPFPSFRSTFDVALINNEYLGVPREYDKYTIDFDNNGNFFIRDGSNPPQELKAFYQRALENFKNTLKVQELNPIQRKNLQTFLLTIQQALGQEILRALQRR